jgi:hypothetical protein
MTTPAQNAKTAALEAMIEAHAIELKLPTVRRRFRALATEATREQQTPVAYLGALLGAEMAERAERRERRRLIDARFPAIKRLEDFRFTDNPKIPQATIAALAEGSWITDRDSVILTGDSGTGKTHCETLACRLAGARWGGLLPDPRSVGCGVQARSSVARSVTQRFIDAWRLPGCPGYGYVRFTLPAPAWSSAEWPDQKPVHP